MSVGIRYEGLREVAQALREIDAQAFGELKRDLAEAGDIVRIDAVRRFTPIDQRSAVNFKTLVRTSSSQMGILSVGQSLRKTTGLRPDYGALQMTRALLPARAENIGKVAEKLEQGAARLLHDHGF